VDDQLKQVLAIVAPFDAAADNDCLVALLDEVQGIRPP